MVADVDYLLDDAGLGIDHVMAQTLHQRIDTIERIHRMAASAEAAPPPCTRSCATGQASPPPSAPIEDAEYALVDPAGAAAEEATQQTAAEAAE
jgi:hypothetical protein